MCLLQSKVPCFYLLDYYPAFFQHAQGTKENAIAVNTIQYKIIANETINYSTLWEMTFDGDLRKLQVANLGL